MPERNASIAAVLDEIADLLDIQGANPFRVRAYRNAARSISDIGTEVDVLIEQGTPITDIAGIGEDLAKRIVEILHTGTCDVLKQLHAELSPAITQLLRIPALGPRRVKTLYYDLHIQNLEQLLDAANAGLIRGLPGFGEKTERRIAQTVQSRIAMAHRHPLVTAASYAEPLADYLRALPGVSRVEIAGSYRRMRATVGDIDMVAIAAPDSAIMERFVAYPEVNHILSKGPTRSSVLIDPGLQIDLRSMAEESFGAAMVYFTGSKAHNIAIRRMGQELGLKINEYGVFREAVRIAGDTEDSVYETVDLPWIPPELREGRGEIEAAQSGKLPKLIEDLQGDLHLRLTPGESPTAMLQAAHTQGLKYIAIVMEVPESAREDVAWARSEISALRDLSADKAGPAVMIGAEAGIEPTGQLDIGDSVLRLFDLVIASVRGELNLAVEAQTQRVLTALEHPGIAVFAQPRTTEDARFDLDFAAVARKAARCGIALEISLHPDRIAPPEHFLESAKRAGAQFVITSEASNPDELRALRFSLGFARQGGLEPAQVLYTKRPSVLTAWLEDRRKESGR